MILLQIVTNTLLVGCILVLLGSLYASIFIRNEIVTLYERFVLGLFTLPFIVCIVFFMFY